MAYAGVRAVAAALAPIYGIVARTGVGSDACLDRGFLPVPIHFYEPIFDHRTLPASIWDRRSDLPGIPFDEDEQVQALRELAVYGSEPKWPRHGNGAGYHWNNPSFGYTSACLLYAVLRRHRPNRVLEIGAGMSTLVAAEAVKQNGNGTITTVDPYAPNHAYVQDVKVITQEAQEVPLTVFEELDESDLLFIDSSHVARTGSDVNYLYLEVLPRLRPGVLVHMHDIYLPYEYPRVYSQREQSRQFWNEQYLLQAFLAMNSSYRVELATHLLWRDHSDLFSEVFPGYDASIHRDPTSFYIRRV